MIHYHPQVQQVQSAGEIVRLAVFFHSPKPSAASASSEVEMATPPPAMWASTLKRT